MTQKPFEELTIADDFMFCKVMECEPICKEFLEMLDRGSRQAKLETARILKQLGDSVQKIAQATGLTQAEVEAIN